MHAPYFFYLAHCSDGSLYAGITNNLTRREARHNRGTGAKYTAKRRPIVIVYSEEFESKSEAAKREREVKKWSRRKKIRLILDSPVAESIVALSKEQRSRFRTRITSSHRSLKKPKKKSSRAATKKPA